MTAHIVNTKGSVKQMENKKIKKEGKLFEADFKQSLQKLGWVSIRLKDDAQNFYGRNRNICDFIAYSYPMLYLLELKSYNTNSIPLAKITQLDDLLKYSNTQGVISGVVLNYRKFNRTFFILAKDLEKITERKSISLDFAIEYGVEIPMRLKRTRYHYDFDVMKGLTTNERRNE